MNEYWGNIPNYKGYQISNLGRVKSFRRRSPIIMSPGLNNKGYYHLTLYGNGKRKSRTIHQLMAETFLNHKPNKYNGLIINHININKLDNRLENIELVTPRENCNLKHIPSTSKYVGVDWFKLRKKWRSRIQINDKEIHLGLFISELDAHKAYQYALSNV